jgi:hypothetical protein
MKFECGDLEQALVVPELMAEAREHLKHCALCRREYHLWNEISSAGRELHEEWETPSLWPRIREAIEAGRKVKPPRWQRWQTWALAAGLLLALTASTWFLRYKSMPTPSPAVATARTSAPALSDRDFLTEQALAEVEKSEAAYRRSIDKLSQLAEAKLKNNTSARAVSEHEKLLAIDSAIADTRANVRVNRFNVHLQATLADLYREKQQTLQELLARDQKN